MNHIFIITMDTTQYFKCSLNGFIKITWKIKISYYYITHKEIKIYNTDFTHCHSFYSNAEYL
jgi:hypothetical protein